MSLPQVNRRKKEPKPKTTTSQKEIEENFCDKIRLEAATSDPQIVHVSKLEISSLNCQLLNELGPLDPDALLAEFFRLPKYFPVFSDQVKMLPTFITDCD